VRRLLLLVALAACGKRSEPPRGGADAPPPRPPDARPAPPPDAAAPAPDSPPPGDAGGGGGGGGKPCKRTEFETEMVAKACAAGGQEAAKTAMKKFVRESKSKDPKLECKSCHDKLAPDYPNKPDALEKFKELGGR
jgi:hypothetical protein